jgi:hypothetical protein
LVEVEVDVVDVVVAALVDVEVDVVVAALVDVEVEVEVEVDVVVAAAVVEVVVSLALSSSLFGEVILGHLVAPSKVRQRQRRIDPPRAGNKLGQVRLAGVPRKGDSGPSKSLPLLFLANVVPGQLAESVNKARSLDEKRAPSTVREKGFPMVTSFVLCPSIFRDTPVHRHADTLDIYTLEAQ